MKNIFYIIGGFYLGSCLNWLFNVNLSDWRFYVLTVPISLLWLIDREYYKNK
jgi:hypothetical protein